MKDICFMIKTLSFQGGESPPRGSLRTLKGMLVFLLIWENFKKFFKKALTYNDFSLPLLVVPGVAKGYWCTRELYEEQGPHSSGQKDWAECALCSRLGQEVAAWPKTSYSWELPV